jgi:uncharacterized integral membrane protein
MAMRAIFRFLVLAPIALLLLGLSLANRQMVTISTDPFNSGDVMFPQISAPLYVIFVGSIMIGVVIGGFSTWVSQGRHRKAARAARQKSAGLKAENDALRTQVVARSPSGSNSIVPISRSAA